MRHPALATVLLAASVVARVASAPPQAQAVPAVAGAAPSSGAARAFARRDADLAALETFRPGYPFWQYIFMIPDGSIAFGSATDGRLIAVLPVRGDWTREGVWADPSLSDMLGGQQLSPALDKRRGQVAALLEPHVGPVLHNPTRGGFLLPNVPRYARFLREWGAIYERFGVPAEIGLAQVVLESGFSGTRRSEARAIGFCQWLERNWRRLDRLSPHVLEGYNQTTQAPYCAAYLTVLATKYGSFIPALSEHNAGGANVGRTLINGERLGGADVRERYFLGSDLARDLRAIALNEYRDIYRTYGPRSYRYAEMVFGNTFTVRELMRRVEQQPIFAMRTTRRIPLAEITRRTKLGADEVRLFNPALNRSVPAGATLYLPRYVQEFGADVSFWHREPSPKYADVLEDFLALDAAPEEWDDPAFAPVLREFQRRFRSTKTEEGIVMDTVLAYVMEQLYESRLGAILAEYRSSADVLRLFRRGVLERDAARAARVAAAEDVSAD